MKDPEYVSIPQLAKILGISRTAVYKKVKQGKVRALRVGRSYAIPIKEVQKILSKIKRKPLSDEAEGEINEVIDRAIREYGETLKLLGDE